MKKYISIFILLALLTSCGEDFLTKEPHEFTDAVFWKTADQAEAALAGAYSPLQDEDALGGQEWCGMEAFSDIGYMNDPYPDFMAMSEFVATQNTENLLSLNSYKSYYKVIKRATDILEYVPGMTIADAQKNRILGEANFLKGFAYFELAIRYGGLPLYNSKDPSASLVRETKENTWAVIETSLQEATTLLEWDHQEGRPGLGAAWGMLAKVYAYEEKWAEAKAAAETVVTSGTRPLACLF